MEIAAALSSNARRDWHGLTDEFSNISPCDRALVGWPLEVDGATLCAPWNMRCHKTPIA